MKPTPTADTADSFIRTHDLTRDDLVRENAHLRRRLDAMREERDAAQRAHRPRDIRGLLAIARDAMNGRTGA
jgi:hypothetical protein